MRPFLVLLGFVLGSSASITFALGASALIFLTLRAEHARLADEIEPLLVNLGIFVGLTAIAAISFYAELKGARWRIGAAALLGAAVFGVGVYYWPE
jgi:hypothetical protein